VEILGIPTLFLQVEILGIPTLFLQVEIKNKKNN
jgi:hypothetical protein